MHPHTFRRVSTVTLSLLDTAQRYELMQTFRCTGCGSEDVMTGYALNTGRHLAHTELAEVARQERLYGRGKATRERARR